MLSDISKQNITTWIKRYPADKKKSGLLEALKIAQEQNNGYLTKELIAEVADFLEVSRIAAYEVATFYSMYEHKEVGKHKICVCTNVSCMLRGSDEIVNHLKDKLKINFNEITADKKFSLKEVECLGACVNAPVVQIGKDYHENLTCEKIDSIIAGLD